MVTQILLDSVLFNTISTLYLNVEVIHNKEHYFYKNKRGWGAVAFPAYRNYGYKAIRAISSLLGKCKARLRWYFRQTLSKMRIYAHESDEKRRQASAAYVPDDASKGWSQGERVLTSKVARNIRCMIHIWSLKNLNIDTSTQKIACGPSWREGVAVLGGYFLHESSRKAPGWCCCCSSGGGGGGGRGRGREGEGGAGRRRCPDGFWKSTPPRWATASMSFLPGKTAGKLPRWP